MSTRVSHCDPRLMDFVTWSVIRGVRLFQRVRVTQRGLVVTERIPQFDFAVVVPVRAVLSVLNVVKDPSFPLRVAPENAGDELPWWPDLTWGSFAFVGLMSQCWITGNVKGIQSYLDILPFDPSMPIGKMADAAIRRPEYRAAVKPLSTICRASDENFDLAFKHSYCLFRRHGIPLWSASTGGHPHFASSVLAQPRNAGDGATSSSRPTPTTSKGEIIGLVPVLDLAGHSAEPNATVGFPDAEMMQWLAQERGLPTGGDDQYIVLQTLRDLEVGESITVDKNQFYAFDKETFNAWFGFPHDVPVVVAETATHVKAPPPQPSPSPPQQEDKSSRAEGRPNAPQRQEQHASAKTSSSSAMPFREKGEVTNDKHSASENDDEMITLGSLFSGGLSSSSSSPTATSSSIHSEDASDSVNSGRSETVDNSEGPLPPNGESKKSNGDSTATEDVGETSTKKANPVRPVVSSPASLNAEISPDDIFF